jgi:glycosyltransferase involved in cell wall biosynthesis
VGDGPLEAELRAALPADGPVRLTGYRADAAAVLAAADVACLTSRNEALPLALIEAAAAGRPLLSSDVGGAREVVEDDRTGYLFPAGDTAALASGLVRLADDEPLRRRLGEGARRRYDERFTLVATVRGYARILHAARGARLRLPAPGAT